MKKRILSAMLSVIMIAAIFPAVPAAAALKKGDLDNDGKITAADARRVLRASVKLEKLTPEETAAADTDGDNEITAGDARKILRASVGLESLHVHNYVKHEVIKKSTCKEKGTEKLICECGAFITKELPLDPDNHASTVIKNKVEATCVKKGYTGDTVCSACGKILKKGTETPINPEGHSFKLREEKATCTTDGYRGYECEYCLVVKDKEITQKATGHKWAAENEVVEATCTDDGYEQRVCTVCKATEKVPGTEKPATGHEYTWTIETPATCVKTGIKNGVCENCGHKEKKIIPITTHTPVLVTIKEGSCTQQEITQLKCSVCGIELDDPITGEFKHQFKVKETVQETCTTPAYQIKECRLCHEKVKVKTKDAPGHTAEIKEKIPATCTKDGKVVYSGECKICHAVLDNATVILKATGHSPDREYATCTEPVRCQRCNEIIKPALGHDVEIKNSALGRDINGLLCRRCNNVVEKPLGSFNTIVNMLKHPVYTNTHNVKTFSKTSMDTRYTRFDFGIYTDAIKGIYDDEMANSPDEFSPVRTGEVWQWMPVNPISVSLLSDSDIDSITVDKLNGIKMNEVLSSFPDEFTSRKNVYNIADEKKVNINEDVIRVTINVKNETLKQVEALSENTSTSLQKIYNFDIRDEKRGYKENAKGELVMHEAEQGPGYNISMDMKLREIYTDAVVTFYFAADDYEPIAAVYNIYIKYDQSVDMDFSIGLFTLHGVIDPEIKTSYTNVYLFKNK